MRNLGLDIGDKRIGVAVSDPEEILATPLTTITRDSDEQARDAILELVGKYEVQRIVVGLPYRLDGSVGTQARKVMDFVEKVSKCTEVDIETRDERLSTVAVERLLAEAGTKGNARKQRSDAAAAAYILQGYMEGQKASD